MRGLASRGVRPCLRQGSTFSASSSVPSVRHPIIPSPSKGITSVNASPVRLPGECTAAFVADIAFKDGRSRAWDQRIAAVEHGINRLRERQAESWAKLQQRSVRRGVLEQRRRLTTSARPTLEVSEDMDPWHSEKEIEAAERNLPDNTSSTEITSSTEFIEDHLHAQKRFERLIATRLALQFILQLRAGRSHIYNAPTNINPDHEQWTQSLDYLVRELNRINHLMSAMRIDKVPWDLQLPVEYVKRRAELGYQLDEVILRYRTGEIHLPDFVMAYSKLIGEFKIGPPMRTYVNIMRTLSMVQQDGSPMAAMTEIAIWNMHQKLNSFAISNILFRHGSDTESWRFTQFLTRITKADSWPRPSKPWFRTNVNDMQICIPESRSPHVITTLIRAALCNQQQTIAEAYGSVFFHRCKIDDYAPHFKWFVVSCFLQSYGQWGSWNIGQRWLHTAVLWADDFLIAGENTLGRVILRMLDFCVACNKREEYDHILAAALAYRLKVPELDESKPLKLSERMQQIRLDWIAQARQQRATHENLWRRVSPEDVQKFQTALKDRFDAHQALPSQRPFHPSDSDFEESNPPPMTYNPFVAEARLAEAKAQRYMSTTQKLHDMAKFGIENPMQQPVEKYSWGGQFSGLDDSPESEETTQNSESKFSLRYEDEEDTVQDSGSNIVPSSENWTEDPPKVQQDESILPTSPFFARATENVYRPLSRADTYYVQSPTLKSDTVSPEDPHAEVKRLRAALAEAEERLKRQQSNQNQQEEDDDLDDDEQIRPRSVAVGNV